jgi:hypothetical protein
MLLPTVTPRGIVTCRPSTTFVSSTAKSSNSQTVRATSLTESQALKARAAKVAGALLLVAVGDPAPERAVRVVDRRLHALVSATV